MNNSNTHKQLSRTRCVRINNNTQQLLVHVILELVRHKKPISNGRRAKAKACTRAYRLIIKEEDHVLVDLKWKDVDTFPLRGMKLALSLHTNTMIANNQTGIAGALKILRSELGKDEKTSNGGNGAK